MRSLTTGLKISLRWWWGRWSFWKVRGFISLRSLRRCLRLKCKLAKSCAVNFTARWKGVQILTASSCTWIYAGFYKKQLKTTIYTWKLKNALSKILASLKNGLCRLSQDSNKSQAQHFTKSTSKTSNSFTEYSHQPKTVINFSKFKTPKEAIILWVLQKTCINHFKAQNGSLKCTVSWIETKLTSKS